MFHFCYYITYYYKLNFSYVSLLLLHYLLLQAQLLLFVGLLFLFLCSHPTETPTYYLLLHIYILAMILTLPQTFALVVLL